MSTGEWFMVIGFGLALIAIGTWLVIMHIENLDAHEATRRHISSSSDETRGRLDDIKRAVADKWKSITRPGSRW